jgi:uncharacterized protein
MPQVPRVLQTSDVHFAKRLMKLRPLSLIETRVLGVLIEKQHTVPDTYPLSLNALTSGCNQKTSRDPVIEATEAEVQSTIDELKSLDLINEASGSRVTRYAHNFMRVVGVPQQMMALLTVLMLRGPQTLSELRINSERLHKFADLSVVETFMREFAEKGFVVELPKAPGARETRWAHLLSGAVDVAHAAPQGSAPHERASVALDLDEIATLRKRVSALEAEQAALKETVEKLLAQLGG